MPTRAGVQRAQRAGSRRGVARGDHDGGSARRGHVRGWSRRRRRSTRLGATQEPEPSNNRPNLPGPRARGADARQRERGGDHGDGGRARVQVRSRLLTPRGGVRRRAELAESRRVRDSPHGTSRPDAHVPAHFRPDLVRPASHALARGKGSPPHHGAQRPDKGPSFASAANRGAGAVGRAGARGGSTRRRVRLGPLAPAARPAGPLRRVPARGGRRRVRVFRGVHVAG
mmetsp:Transcript_3109/g.13923  ORF Transcript_3109/g.13923 Transcript_3109/m.13923 type:complete len:228 (-) Transcript_3109:1624-2307(-)